MEHTQASDSEDDNNRSQPAPIVKPRTKKVSLDSEEDEPVKRKRAETIGDAAHHRTMQEEPKDVSEDHTKDSKKKAAKSSHFWSSHFRSKHKKDKPVKKERSVQVKKSNMSEQSDAPSQKSFDTDTSAFVQLSRHFNSGKDVTMSPPSHESVIYYFGTSKDGEDQESIE